MGSLSDADVHVVAPAGTRPGEYAVAFVVTVTETPGSSDRCVTSWLTVGLPLLLLIPTGLAPQVNI